MVSDQNCFGIFGTVLIGFASFQRPARCCSQLGASQHLKIEREEKPSRRTLVDSDNFVSIAASMRPNGCSVTVKDGHSKMVARPKGKYADFCIIGVEAVEQK